MSDKKNEEALKKKWRSNEKKEVCNQKGNEIFTADDKEFCRYNNILWSKTNKSTMQKWTNKQTNQRMNVQTNDEKKSNACISNVNSK